MGDVRFEGSPSHEYVIERVMDRARAAGWRVLRLRERSLPAVAVRAGSVRGILSKGSPFGDSSFPELDAWTTVTVEPCRSDTRTWHREFFDAVEHVRRVHVADGWHVVPLYSWRPTGFLGIRIPDAIAVKGNAIVAVEAARAAGVRGKFQAYGMFDDVVVAKFPSGTVFSSDRPPRFTTHSKMGTHPFL